MGQLEHVQSGDERSEYELVECDDVQHRPVAELDEQPELQPAVRGRGEQQLPADAPEEVDFGVGPKASSVPEPASSSATNEQIVQQSSEELAQELAGSESKSETTENPPTPPTNDSDLAGAANS